MRETKSKWILHLGLIAVLLILGAIWQPLAEIPSNLLKVLRDPSFLTRDYAAVGGIGAAFWNAALLLALELLLVVISGGELKGKLMASIFITVGGALFGINVVGALPIFLGAWIYSLLSREAYKDLLFTAFMSAGLAPLVSICMFALGLPPVQALALGIAVGIAAGILMQILVKPLAAFHQGFTLYNAGFVTGIVGMALVALMRTYGLRFESESVLSDTLTLPFALFLLITSLTMFLLGLRLCDWKWEDYGKILRSKGKLLEYDKEFGTGAMLLNMGLMGLLSLPILLLCAGHLNGAMVGATMGMIGFSAVGQNPLNSWPIVAGVILANLLKGGAGNMNGAMVMAMYGTCLAPVTSEFGILAGILAGFTHSAVVGTALLAHGGADLFNNGFSSGFVGAILVPLFTFIRGLHEKGERK